MPFPTAVPDAPLRTQRCVIRAQREADNDSDYAAVMANRGWLRRWSGSDWPADDFGRDENLDDLRGHIEEHVRGEAYGFSVLAPDESRVVGSLYLQPVSELLEEYGASDELVQRLAGCDARADLWVRLDEDAQLLADVGAAAHRWLAHDWGLSVVWCARVDCPELEAAYASAGLALLARLVHPDSGRVHLLFGAL